MRLVRFVLAEPAGKRVLVTHLEVRVHADRDLVHVFSAHDQRVHLDVLGLVLLREVDVDAWLLRVEQPLQEVLRVGHVCACLQDLVVPNCVCVGQGHARGGVQRGHECWNQLHCVHGDLGRLTWGTGVVGGRAAGHNRASAAGGGRNRRRRNSVCPTAPSPCCSGLYLNKQHLIELANRHRWPAAGSMATPNCVGVARYVSGRNGQKTPIGAGAFFLV